jgi:NDP-sugar pyrophosphorylase family protein
MNQYKVLITTSGTGSRLKELTKNTNKALVPISGRPTISYVLDSYPKDVPLVITLGYLADQVKDFLLKNYADRTVEFVTVDKYQGEGSSQLYSTLCAKENLQCPFIFHACDTIILEKVPEPAEDWIAGYVVSPENVDISQYRSHKVGDEYVLEVQDKGAPHFDSIHIGMIGVKNYKLFWDVAERLYAADPTNQALGDVPVIEKMIAEGAKFKWVPFTTWLDTGNLQALELAAKTLVSSNK